MKQLALALFGAFLFWSIYAEEAIPPKDPPPYETKHPKKFATATFGSG